MLSYSYNIKGETNVMEKKSNHFSGQLGFVLAAAGSAVGVGNLWRFPYLAAKDGGRLIFNYLPDSGTNLRICPSHLWYCHRTAYTEECHRSLYPDASQMEVPGNPYLPCTSAYYDLLRGHRRMDYQICGGIHNRSGTGSCRRWLFYSLYHISTSPVIFALLFMGVTAFIVYNGVEKGIEKVSKWMSRSYWFWL